MSQCRESVGNYILSRISRTLNPIASLLFALSCGKSCVVPAAVRKEAKGVRGMPLRSCANFKNPAASRERAKDEDREEGRDLPPPPPVYPFIYLIVSPSLASHDEVCSFARASDDRDCYPIDERLTGRDGRRNREEQETEPALPPPPAPLLPAVSSSLLHFVAAVRISIVYYYLIFLRFSCYYTHNTRVLRRSAHFIV